MDHLSGARIGEAVVQERAERVRVAIAHRLEAALLKFEDSVFGHTRLPLACLRKRSPGVRLNPSAPKKCWMLTQNP